jgi:hypothetical protein
VPARPLSRELERKAVDARYAGPRENRNLGRDFLRQAAVCTAAASRIFAFGILANDHPVDVLSVSQRTGDSRQHARGANVRVLIETLADRQPQSPQRHVIGNVGRPHRTEENCVEAFQLFETTFRNVVPVRFVVLAAPREMLDVEAKGFIAAGEYFEHLKARCDDFDSDPIPRDRGDSVRAHVAAP